eukprot:TRINITY_DN887_c0_g1_i4.p1 TRINITY_DN887_c0_g1~~TRINITY_DN887_c0_g1_i4.p1  ORF type:complete len:318 (+),score=70.16 TRINITY_DN887_c0_g1_i4:535-1488(+)
MVRGVHALGPCLLHVVDRMSCNFGHPRTQMRVIVACGRAGAVPHDSVHVCERVCGLLCSKGRQANQARSEHRQSIVSAVNATLETLDPIKRTLIERSKQEEADRQRQEEEAAAAATAATAAAVEAVAAAAAAAADASEMESVASEAESAVSEIESAAPETAPEEPQSLSDKAHVVLERSSDAAAEVPAVAEPADISEAESSQMAVDPAEAGAVTLSEAEPMPVETPTAPQPSSSTDDWALIELDDGPNPADAAVNAPHPPMDVESDASSVDAAPSDAYANLERLSFDEIRRMLLQKDAYIRELESRVSVLQSNANLA